MKYLLLLAGILSSAALFSQDHGFPFGSVTYKDLEMKSYPADTAAIAVVLNEFGEAYIDEGNDNNLSFVYHAKIKILRQEGVRLGTFEVSAYKQDNRTEKVKSVKASSFNYENGTMKESKMDWKDVHTVNENKYWDVTRFALPNVKVGTVIEVMYTVESPFIYKFRNWEFQSEIPKVFSEYWATIPANYKFNISIKGFLKLDKDEGEVIRDCFTPNGMKADCGRYKWAMKNIPAFRDEDYMTARSNFLSMINFELSEIHYFDGKVDKVTKDWKAVEGELRSSESFGVQLRKGKSIVDDHVEALITGEPDQLKKAQKIYGFIKEWYRWDNIYGKYSELGIKKAFDKKTGNVGDINLSLIAALKYGGIDTEPLLLSTRSNGLPTELHPVLSDFNYVIAKVNINYKVYLVDATDPYLPFGMIPERCLNGKGRALGEKESYWYEIKTNDRARFISIMNVKLDKNGRLTGTLATTYQGYDAVDKRKDIARAGGKDAYIKTLRSELKEINITTVDIQNENELNLPLIVKLDIEIQCFDDMNASHFLFNPFLIGKWDENPFKSNERLYPVDFGPSLDQTFVLSMEFPDTFQPIDLPQKVGLALPNAGGKYLFNATVDGNKLAINNVLQISRPVFSSNEYHYLKELFARVISNQQTDLFFKRKS